MNPHSVSLLELLAQDEKPRFTVPTWRRPYTWSVGGARGEVDRFWSDLHTKSQQERKHFCGVMLFNPLPPPDASVWELVDGQQRLATFFLLLIALRDTTAKRGVDGSDLNELLTDPITGACRLVLQEGASHDRTILNALLKGIPPGLDQKALDESKLHQAYRYLAAQIEKEIPSGSQEFLLSILQETEVRIQSLKPTNQTRMAFETLDARARQPEAKEPPPSRPDKKTARVPLPAPARASRPSVSLGILGRKIIAALGLGLIAALCLFAAFTWRSYTVHVFTYDRQVLSAYDGPQGLLPLTRDEARHRLESYGIESLRGKAVCIANIDGSGNLIDNPSMHGVAVQEIHYGENGLPAQIVFRDRNSIETVRENYSDFPGSAAGKSRQVQFAFQAYNPPADPFAHFYFFGIERYGTASEIDKKSGITGETIDYSTDGRHLHVQYLKGKDPARLRRDGVLARSFEYNATGQATKISNEGQDGKTSPDKHGIASVTRTFDSSGNQTSETYLGLSGQPLLGPDGFAGLAFKYDSWGNTTEMDFLGADGKPVFCKLGFAQLKATYDDHGRLIEQSCLGIDGKPLLNNRGFASEKFAYGPRGNITRASYFGIDGKPVLDHDGFASESFAYDARGNVIEITGSGIDGQPVVGNSGSAKMAFKYNDQNEKVSVAYFNAAGQPAVNVRGIAQELFVYDDKGNVAKQSYMDTDGHPVANTEGVAVLVARYDDTGHLDEMSCYGIDGNLTLDRNGVATETYEYDGAGNLIKTACFGVDGKPALDKGGAAIARFKYNDLGERTESAYFDVEDKPVLNSDGFAREVYKYDARSNMIEKAYFDIEGQATLSLRGFAKETLKYDDRDRIIEAACFGLEDRPIDVGGAHQIVYVYDASGKIARTDRFDSSGQPVP
jgi:YD repeat-containing protein